MSVALSHALTNNDDLTVEFCTILSLSEIFGALAQCGHDLVSEAGNNMTDESGNQLVVD